MLQEEKNLQQIIQSTCVKGMDIVLSNTFLDGIESTTQLFNDPYAHERLRRALETVSEQYDVCIIDIPPFF